MYVRVCVSVWFVCVGCVCSVWCACVCGAVGFGLWIGGVGVWV